jgi:Mn-containing catalase
VVYEYLYRQIDNKKVQNSGSNRDFGTTKAAKMYFSMSDPVPNAFATGDTRPFSFE